MRDFHYFFSYQTSWHVPNPFNRQEMIPQVFAGNAEIALSKPIKSLDDVRALEQHFRGVFSDLKPEAERVDVVILSYSLLKVKRHSTNCIQSELIQAQISKLLG